MSNAVYTMRDASGAPLYVGVTHRIEQRLGEHANDKPWWPQVASIGLEWFASRDEALRHERKRIAELAPPFNVTITESRRGDRWSRRDEAHAAGRRCNEARCRHCAQMAASA